MILHSPDLSSEFETVTVNFIYRERNIWYNIYKIISGKEVIMIHQTKDLRSFAYIWAAIFTFIGVIPLFKNHDIKIWALGIAVAFILIAWI